MAAPGALHSPWVLAWSQQACLAPAVPSPSFGSKQGRIQPLLAGLHRMGASAVWQLVQDGFGLSLGGGDKAAGPCMGWVQGCNQAPTWGVTGIGLARGPASPAIPGMAGLGWDLPQHSSAAGSHFARSYGPFNSQISKLFLQRLMCT